MDGRLRRTWNTFGTTSQYLCKRRHSAFLQPSDKACPRRDPVIYLSSECTLPLQSEDHMVLDRACQQRNFVVAGGLGLCGGCELATFSRNPCPRCKPSTPHTTGELWFGELTRLDACFVLQLPVRCSCDDALSYCCGRRFVVLFFSVWSFWCAGLCRCRGTCVAEVPSTAIHKITVLLHTR